MKTPSGLDFPSISGLCQAFAAAASLLLTIAGPGLHRVSAAVYISEFLADNSAGLRTTAGDYADWIELFNDGTTPVSLGGWSLTDDPARPAKWQFPTGTTIAGRGYLLVFADNSPTALTNGELHANFSLDKDGEYLALVGPDGTSAVDEFGPKFPKQLENKSYGHSVQERELLSTGSSARYRVPAAEAASAWFDATGGIGFASTNSGIFTTRYYEMASAFGNVDAAIFMMDTPSFWKTDRSYPIISTYPFINFLGTDAPGNFAGDAMFPGHSAQGEARESFAVVVDGPIYIPTGGQWTFAVGSDDGFRLTIRGHGLEFISEYPTDRGFDTTLSTFNFPEPGIYDLHLVYYQNFGGSGLELSAAQGFYDVFAPEAFTLVGGPQSAITHASSISSAVQTDVQSLLYGVNTRLDAEWTFNVSEQFADGDTVVLSVLIADGMRAWLNGAEVASLNAPESLAWNSAATAKRSPEQALSWVSFTAPASLLRAGTNVLSIAALNDAAQDMDFLVQPRITLRMSQNSTFYYKSPTPGYANSRGFTAPTPKVHASERRGFRTAPFQVTLTNSSPGTVIRYTLDGSTPRTNSPMYSAPLNISRTTALRTAVVDPASVRQDVTTVTWIFLEDSLTQPSTPPPGWPASRQVNNHVMEYGMNPSILGMDSQRLRAGMTSAIPSISLVTDLPHLFSPQTGIYVNPANDGLGWERPVSIEMIDPVRGPGGEFHIDGGVRIRGAYSRSAGNPKHSLRLFFRPEYDGKLRFPLFDDEGANEFEKVDLRTSQNYAWGFENSPKETFIRETFSRDSQRDMGMPYTRSRYYHLYINGLYWGLYQTQERGDADYAEAYLGSEDTDWDCIKTTQPGYTTTASDGNFNAFLRLFQIAINEGFGGAYASNYWRVQGLNSDGTRNPALPKYVDPDNLIVYMLIAYYVGDPDSPVSIWGGMPNNMYALFNRAQPGGFKWLRHDAEHSLGANGSYPVTSDTTGAGAGFTTFPKFNPATLHQKLCAHPDYRLRFADLAQKHLFGSGALTPTNSQARFLKRMSEIDLAIVGESARWGRGRTRDNDWLPECLRVVNGYFPVRRAILMGQLRNRGWISQADAPSFSAVDETVPAGYPLRISGVRTFYYTTNGADPRMPDGTINPAALVISGTGDPGGATTIVDTGSVWRYYDLGSEPTASGTASWRDSNFPDKSWAQGPAIVGFPGSSTANDVATVTRRYVNGASGAQITTTYLRRAFQLKSTNGITSLSINLLRDDGVVVYLNGTEILRDNMPSGGVDYWTYSSSVMGSPSQNTYSTIPIDAARLLRLGTNVLAAEVHQANAGSSDLYFDLGLTAVSAPTPVAAQLIVTNGMLVKARGYDGRDWSGLAETTLKMQQSPADYARLRVAEIMYAPTAPPQGSAYDADDFAWMELVNSGQNPLNLDGIRFTSGINFTSPPATLNAGERIVLAKNIAAFATRYATNGIRIAQFSGNIARRGETLTLTRPDATNIFSFTYTNTWYPETFNTGRSLVAIDYSAEDAAWSAPVNWRPSGAMLGSPGLREPPSFQSSRVGTDGKLSLAVIGLERPVQVLFSSNLQSWAPLAVDAWSFTGTTLTVDLSHSALTDATGTFFKLAELP